MFYDRVQLEQTVQLVQETREYVLTANEGKS